MITKADLVRIDNMSLAEVKEEIAHTRNNAANAYAAGMGKDIESLLQYQLNHKATLS